jgi:hypothetical protein
MLDVLHQYLLSGYAFSFNGNVPSTNGSRPCGDLVVDSLVSQGLAFPRAKGFHPFPSDLQSDHAQSLFSFSFTRVFSGHMR